MISKATDLPAVRADLLTFFADHGELLFRKSIEADQQPLRPGYGTDEDARELTRGEMYRLRDAELFWVSGDMTDLAEVAAPTLPGYSFQPADLPAPAGLIVFQRPVGRTRTIEYGGSEEVGFIQAASWGPTPPGIPDGVWVSWYTNTYLNLERASGGWLAHMSGAAPSADPDDLRHLLRRNMPDLSYDNESLLMFGQGDGSAVTLDGEPCDPTDSPYPLALLRATWTLMQQPLARIETASLNRAERRRLQRAKIEPAAVRVINLRRPKVAGSGSESDRDYHHRWIVRGHWRQQWYPGRQVHRPVWIAPHVKGPDDAPFIGGEKVHAWRR